MAPQTAHHLQATSPKLHAYVCHVLYFCALCLHTFQPLNQWASITTIAAGVAAPYFGQCAQVAFRRAYGTFFGCLTALPVLIIHDLTLRGLLCIPISFVMLFLVTLLTNMEAGKNSIISFAAGAILIIFGVNLNQKCMTLSKNVAFNHHGPCLLPFAARQYIINSTNASVCLTQWLSLPCR